MSYLYSPVSFTARRSGLWVPDGARKARTTITIVIGSGGGGGGGGGSGILLPDVAMPGVGGAPTGRNIQASSESDLQTILSGSKTGVGSLQPGDTIWVAGSASSPTLMDRDSFAPGLASGAGTAALPVTIRCGSWNGSTGKDAILGVQIQRHVQFTNAHVILRGFKCPGGVDFLKGANFCRLNRCLMDRNITASIYNEGTDNTVDRCEVANGNGVLVELNYMQGCRRPWLYGNYVHDQTNPTDPNAHTHCNIMVGTSPQDHLHSMQARVCFNYVSNPTKHNGIEIKTDDNVCYMNTCVGGKNASLGTFQASYLMIRHGAGNLLNRNFVEDAVLSVRHGYQTAPNIAVRNKTTTGASNRYGYAQDNYGGAVSAFDANPQTVQYPRAEFCRVIHHDGAIHVGDTDSTGPNPLGPLNTRFEDCPGAFTTVHAGIGQTKTPTTSWPADDPSSLWPDYRLDLGSAIRLPLSAVGPLGDGRVAGSPLF